MAENPQKHGKFPKTTPVYSYVRFSTPEQKKGTGRQRQDDLAATWCETHGLTLSRNYSDLGVSGFKGRNATEGALSEFLRCIDDGRIRPGSVLVVESLDRLSRNMVRKAAELFLGIINRGVTVVTLCDGQIFSPDSFDFAQLIISLAIFARAHDESLMKSQRKKAAWRIKRDAAKASGTPLGGNTPRWIKVVNGKYVVIEQEADVVRDIFRAYVEGEGLYLLNKRTGIPKPTLSYWLTNPVVLGTVTISDDGTPYQIPNHYPAIIDPGTWAKAQTQKARRYVQRREGRLGFVNLFAGLLSDPDGNRYDVTRTYGFSSYVTPGHLIQCRPLEHALLLHKLATRFVTTKVVDDGGPVEHSPKIGQIERKIEQIRKALLADGTDADELLPVLKELKLQKRQIEQAEAESHVVRESVSYELVRKLADADESDRASRLRLREIVRDTVAEVRVTRVASTNWYKLVECKVTLTDGEELTCRFAYGARREGVVICDGLSLGYVGGKGKGESHLERVDGETLTAESLTPEVIEAINRLPKKAPRPTKPKAKGKRAA